MRKCKSLYIILWITFSYIKTLSRNVLSFPFFLNTHLPTNLAHNMVASEDSMMRGNGHTIFCESCVKPVAPYSLITTIFPRIYARTYYAHPRARVMSFSYANFSITITQPAHQTGHAVQKQPRVSQALRQGLHCTA